MYTRCTCKLAASTRVISSTHPDAIGHGRLSDGHRVVRLGRVHTVGDDEGEVGGAGSVAVRRRELDGAHRLQRVGRVRLGVHVAAQRQRQPRLYIRLHVSIFSASIV